MILQALYDYYQRKAQDPDPARQLPGFGWESKEIPFIIELSDDGSPIGITPSEGRRLVPSAVKDRKSTKYSANLLWDNPEYILGGDGESDKKNKAFRERVERLLVKIGEDKGLVAVKSFYDLKGVDKLEELTLFDKLPKAKAIAFRLKGDDDLVCLRNAVQSAYLEELNETPSSDKMVCLITGKRSAIAPVHADIKSKWRGKRKLGYGKPPSSWDKIKGPGAKFVSFNKNSFESFGKHGKETGQGRNAPVSQEAEFCYSTSLNNLLRDESEQCVQIDETLFVFWAQKEDNLEEGFAAVFGEQDDPDVRTTMVAAVLDAVRTGQFNGGRGDNRFYVLGLAPNMARIAVRFWYAAPLSEIAERVRQWFDDLSIIRGKTDPEYPSLLRLLTACATLGKVDNIPPRLGGDIMRAILSGGHFPETWLNAAVMQFRVVQQGNREKYPNGKQSILYLLAASIKACLNRSQSCQEKELSMQRDSSNQDPAYRLGCLFAALEKVQEEANPGLNTTIRERYYGAASSAPVTVFPTLLRLTRHHLSKLRKEKPWRAKYFEPLLDEIVAGTKDSRIEYFPRYLPLSKQGLFAVGYYHQRQDFFSKKLTSHESQDGESK